MQSAFEILTDILRDNDAEIHRTTPGAYADGLAAAGARIRARMVGLPRPYTSSQGRGDGPGSGWGGGGYDDPKPPSPSPQPAPDALEHSKVIDAEYTIADEPPRPLLRQDRA